MMLHDPYDLETDGERIEREMQAGTRLVAMCVFGGVMCLAGGIASGIWLLFHVFGKH